MDGRSQAEPAENSGQPGNGLPDDREEAGKEEREDRGGSQDTIPASAQTKAGAPGGGDREPIRRGRARKVLLGALALLTVALLGIAGGLWFAVDHYTDAVDRVPHAFPKVSEKDRPPQGKGTNFLLVGLDSRSDLPTTGENAQAPQWRRGAQRSDTMMLLHLLEDREKAYKAYVVSLPRDSWVPIPGHGQAKLNAAFSWGGPPLLIDTVQRLTNVRIDHLMVIDWSGFRKLTDAVGGVDITIAKDIPRRGGERAWKSGRHHMDGETALAYVRERHGLPNGDLDRTKRQQNFLRALVGKTLSTGTLSHPLRLHKLLDQVTNVVSVDDRLSNGDLRDLAWSMRGLRSSDLVLMNAPVGGFDRIRGQSVVLLDENDADLLWEALRTDTMADYLGRRSPDQLPSKVR